MRKEELRTLRALPATREMMEKGKRTRFESRSYWSKQREVSEYDVILRVQNLKGYIKMAIFLPKKMQENIKTPKYEVFLNVAGKEYITRELDDNGEEKKWHTSMVENLDGVNMWNWYYYKDKNIYLNRDGMLTLNRLPLKDDRDYYKGLRRVAQWQQEIRKEKIKHQEQREQAPWDADMKLIPKIPGGFTEWMRREVANEYYIFYEYQPRGAKIGYCSKCKRFVPISSPKHGDRTRCPICGVKAEYKAHKRIQTLSTGNYDAEIIQKFAGGIVIRSFEQRQYYRNKHYTDPEIITREYKRELVFEDGDVKKYWYGLYKNKYHRWILDKNYTTLQEKYYFMRKTMLYKRNLGQIKKTSLLKRSAIDLWPRLPVSACEYLGIESGNPAVEMLAKIGMFKLAEELIDERYDCKLLNESATELPKIMKIDNSRLKRLKEMDGNLTSLRWLQYEKEADKIWPDEMIKDFGEARILSSDFGFLNIPISYVKCHNYLKKQANLMGEGIRQALITWRDYHNMADQMKMNTRCEQISKPKELKVAHDRLIELKNAKGMEKQAKEIAKKWPKVNEQLPKLEKYEYEHGEYKIVAPRNVLDIVREGTILSHCVHTCDYYFERIQTDESYLFFLRKSDHPDMPWYTLEVEPSGNIRQKRTTGDNQNADFQKAVSFLKKWQQFFRKQLTEEEMQLGEKANILREENYKNLREKGNRVWHGKLAGQLLADVLESDFMAAGL